MMIKIYLIPGRIYISCCRYFNQKRKKKNLKSTNSEFKKKKYMYICTKSNPNLFQIL